MQVGPSGKNSSTGSVKSREENSRSSSQLTRCGIPVLQELLVLWFLISAEEKGGRVVGQSASAHVVPKQFTGSHTGHDPESGKSTHHKGSLDRKSTRLNSSHGYISYAVFCLKK